MEYYLKILILALIQGAAELLPVSSSAHVIVAERMMGLDPSTPDMVFLLVMLHTGTMFAVLVYFWPRWLASFKSGSASRHHFLTMVILATVVTGVVGWGLKEFIEKVVLRGMMGRPDARLESLFKNLPLIATALFVAGLLILAAGLLARKVSNQPLTAWPALWIGLLQGLCLPFRGFSRSGATISLGLLLGIPRHLAEDFSFALAVALTPAVIGYSTWHHLKAGNWPTSTALLHLMLPGLVGMVFSFLAGLAALRLLSAVLEKGRWSYFGYYCLAFALLIGAGVASGRLTAPESSQPEAPQVGGLNPATSVPAITPSGDGPGEAAVPGEADRSSGTETARRSPQRKSAP
jgi:undecaprenyl-diphosphatase